MFVCVVSESVLLVLVHWLLNLRDVALLRVVHKFVESDCEKVDRLLELMERSEDRLQAAGERLVDASNASLDDYSRRLSCGLYALQLCCLLLGLLYTAGEARIAQHVRAAFHQRDRDITEVCDVLDEQLGRMDDETQDEQASQHSMKRTIDRLLHLVRQQSV